MSNILFKFQECSSIKIRQGILCKWQIYSYIRFTISTDCNSMEIEYVDAASDLKILMWSINAL